METTREINLEGVRSARAKVGSEATRKSFVPELGVLLWTRDSQKLYIGDGKTPGGIPYSGGINENVVSQEQLEGLISTPEFMSQLANYINMNLDIGNIDGGTF